MLAGRHWDAFPGAARDVLTSGGISHGGPELQPHGLPFSKVRVSLQTDRSEILSESRNLWHNPDSAFPASRSCLMRTGRRVGGYPKIAEVAGVDLHLLAQLRPRRPPALRTGVRWPRRRGVCGQGADREIIHHPRSGGQAPYGIGRSKTNFPQRKAKEC